MNSEGEPRKYPPFRRSATLDDLMAARDAMPSTGPPSEDPPLEVPVEHGRALKIFVLAGVVGVGFVIVGIALGIVSYDQRFIYDSPNPAWEVAATIGLLLVLLGILLVPVSIVGAVIVVIARGLRRARR